MIYKSKTQDTYKNLMILSVGGIFRNNGKSRTVESYEQALVALDELVELTKQRNADCSMLVDNINGYRCYVADPRDAELERLFELKRREMVADSDDRPSIRFTGENLSISENNYSYRAASQAYDRMRREGNRNGDFYIVGGQNNTGRTQFRRSANSTAAYAGPDYEVMERQYINPVTDMRQTICRQIPLGIPANVRREIEEELIRDVERQMERLNGDAARRRNFYYSNNDSNDDYYSSYWDDEPTYRHRRINEDSPNADR